MKKLTLIFTVVFCSTLTFGQKKEDLNLIQVDSTWGKEIIQVPFWFAPEINYEGYEDIRFAKGWEDINSSGFWTLVFAWDINLNTAPTAKFFVDNLKSYYDGLMKVVNEDEELIIPKTKAFFIESKTNNGTTIFEGTVETYDAFTTKRMIFLHVKIESHYCEKAQKYIPLFKFSPKNYEHDVWVELNSIKIHSNICKS